MNELLIAILESQGYRVSKPYRANRYYHRRIQNNGGSGGGQFVLIAIAIIVLCLFFG